MSAEAARCVLCGSTEGRIHGMHDGTTRCFDVGACAARPRTSDPLPSDDIFIVAGRGEVSGGELLRELDTPRPNEARLDEARAKWREDFPKRVETMKKIMGEPCSPEARPELPTDPKPGQVYRHFKGGLYRVIALARMSEERERRVVVYESLEKEVVWVRPLFADGPEVDAWLDKKRWPDGVIRGRFVEEPSVPCSDKARPGGSDTPWPARDVVDKLARAVSILLLDYHYDGHGWEEIDAALKVAQAWLREPPRSAKATPAPPAWVAGEATFHPADAERRNSAEPVQGSPAAFTRETWPYRGTCVDCPQDPGTEVRYANQRPWECVNRERYDHRVGIPDGYVLVRSGPRSETALPEEIDVDGIVDSKGVRFLGKAAKQPDGTWRCLANVGGALCVVEVTVQPHVVHVRPDEKGGGT